MGYLGWSQGRAEVLILRKRLGAGTLQCTGIMGTDDAVCPKENLVAPRQGRRQMREVLWSLLWVPPAFGQELCIAFGQQSSASSSQVDI